MPYSYSSPFHGSKIKFHFIYRFSKELKKNKESKPFLAIRYAIIACSTKMFLSGLLLAHYTLFQLLVSAENLTVFSVSLLKMLFYFTLAFYSSYETVQKNVNYNACFSASFGLWDLIVTLCQCLSLSWPLKLYLIIHRYLNFIFLSIKLLNTSGLLFILLHFQ